MEKIIIIDKPPKTLPVVFAGSGADLVNQIEEKAKLGLGKFYLKQEKKIILGFYKLLEGDNIEFHLKHLSNPSHISYNEADSLTEGLDAVCEECIDLEKIHDYELRRTKKVWWWFMPLRRGVMAMLGPERIKINMNYGDSYTLANRIFDLYLNRSELIKPKHEPDNLLVLYVGKDEPQKIK